MPKYILFDCFVLAVLADSAAQQPGIVRLEGVTVCPNFGAEGLLENWRVHRNSIDHIVSITYLKGCVQKRRRKQN
jgi:hypothetical protein